MEVAFDHVSMRYDKKSSIVLKDMSFTIPDHNLVSVLGPSGCGKSTTLYLISGLLFPTSGRVLFDGEDVTKKDAVDRKVGLVFQNYALYPHMSVHDNIAFPMKIAKIPKKEREEKIQSLAKLVKIEENLNKRPKQLSGGQQQRVAIARALAKEPSILLMDEPLSNLDAKLRLEMREEIKRIQKETGITTVFVTHDQSEALSIADRVMVLNYGNIQQYSTPTELYQNPDNQFVSEFLGTPKLNLFSLKEMNGFLSEETMDVLKKEDVQTVGSHVEDWTIVSKNEASVTAVVEDIEIVGRDRSVTVRLENEKTLLIAEVPITFEVGETVGIMMDQSKAFFFDSKGNRVRVNAK